VTIAVCNPNFHGDVLWSVPAAREAARRHGCQADFWLSLRGQNLVDLLKAQSFVRDVYVEPTYADGFLAPRGDYEKHYHLHLLHAGAQTLLDAFCHSIGLERQGHWLEIPADCPRQALPDHPFVALVSKNEVSPWFCSFNASFCEMTRLLAADGIPVVACHSPDCTVALEDGALDRRCKGYLEMAGIISKCRVFVGTLSGPLVVADAFPDVRRIALYDSHWSLGPCTHSPINHYLHMPSGRQVAELVETIM
jgi:hypothetical protein